MNSNKKKINQIKRRFRKDQKLSEYKNIVANKKMIFVLSKIAIIFKTSLTELELYQLEKNLFENIEVIEQWEKIYYECSKSFTSPYNQCDWKAFGNFMFYVWNQWKYHNNKMKSTSIYTIDNFNEINDLKTLQYNKWMNSLFDTKDHDFNICVRRVLKLI